MIVVTGASGKLGRRVIKQLLLRLPADQIGASVRDPAKLADLAAKGVRVRHGDFTDADSLRHAFAGARRLLLVSSNAAATGGDTLAQHRTAIDVAGEVGVERLFYTSQLSCSPTSHFMPGRSHAATEVMLAQSGLKWTSLRHGFYTDSALAMNERGLDNGALAAPRDGPVAWTSHDDLAAGDAILMTGEEEIDGATSVMSGAETLDLTGIAGIASDVLDKPVRRTVVDDDAWSAQARERGMPDAAIEFAMDYHRAARDDEFAATSPFLERLLGQKPQTFRKVLSDRRMN